MNEQTLKWLVEQSDRGLFIITLGIGGWVVWKVLKRSEAMTDSLMAADQQRSERHARQMEAVQAETLKNCQDVTKIVALNTVATERNNRLLEKMEQKL